MKTHPAILIIIVTWNKKKYVLELLRSLSDLSYPGDCLDVVVVDNASTDHTVEEIKNQYPDVHLLVNDENLGGTGGFNTGLANAFKQPAQQYEYLWLLDNDVVVHRDALTELVAILDNVPEIAVAGSTMMQLTHPWQINEMGAFVDIHNGNLILNRHMEVVESMRGKSVQQLLTGSIDLSRELEDCQSWMEVDYVAAASLLIRSSVAEAAGLWDDFFIHFDDVEWCLRIRKMGYGIVASARSLIWHLPGINKVPTWVMYYDIRNVLYLLEKHGGAAGITGAEKRIRKKILYYTLLGKEDMAGLIKAGLDDFHERIYGKKEITLDSCYYDLEDVEKIVSNPEICTVLIPWTVHLQASNLQRIFAKVLRERVDFQVNYLLPLCLEPDMLSAQLPGEKRIILPSSWPLRLWYYISRIRKYDLVVQSDYRPILPLAWLGKKLLYVNNEFVSLRKTPRLNIVFSQVKSLLWSKKS